MSPEDQRIAIAESVGWTAKRSKSQILEIESVQWLKPDHMPAHPREVSGLGAAYLPDYLGDLNAMHEAEKALKPKTIRAYTSCIFKLLISNGGRCLLFHATAAQRAEAYLRTIGKWKD